MSEFEGRVRPFLEPMILGKRVFLNREDRDSLAQYLTFKMLVLDWIGDDPILPREWAQTFYRSREIPRHTQIHLFRCFPGAWNNIDTTGAGFLEEDDPRPVEPNTKSFAVGFGELFVFALMSAEIEFKSQFEPAITFQLWPFEPMLMLWPPPIIIDEGQARFISTTIERITGSLESNEGGEPLG